MAGETKSGQKKAYDVRQNTLLNDMIFFTIDDVTYKAVKGMTWGEWVESEYNTGSFEIYYGTLCLNHNAIFAAGGGEGIGSFSVIVPLAYKTSNVHGGGSN